MADKTFSNWIQSLTQVTPASGDLLPIIQGGATRAVPAAAANGIATLDSAGKLMQPRRVIDFAQAVGSTATLSTTTTTVKGYILPDPRASVTIPTGATAVVNIGVCVTADTAGAIVQTTIVYSVDGGSTWQSDFSKKYSAATIETANAKKDVYMHGYLTVSGTVTIGISMWSSTPGATVTAYGAGLRGIQVLIVDY